MSRIQRILYKLAQQEAPHLTPPGWDQQGEAPTRIQQLARRLADYGTLALVGQLAPDLLPLEAIYVQDWIHSYARLYELLVQALFPPTLTQINAVYADNHQPTVVIFRAPAAPILACFSAFVAPYVAYRQPTVREDELFDLMNLLLDELEAGNLPTRTLDELRYTGMEVLVQMLHATVRHVSLTDMDARVQALLRPDPPAPPPEAQAFAVQSAPPPPGGVPGGVPGQGFEMTYVEEDSSSTQTPTEQMFRISLPIPKPGGTSKRRPPVPPLPDKKDNEGR